MLYFIFKTSVIKSLNFEYCKSACCLISKRHSIWFFDYMFWYIYQNVSIVSLESKIYSPEVWDIPYHQRSHLWYSGNGAQVVRPIPLSTGCERKSRLLAIPFLVSFYVFSMIFPQSWMSSILNVYNHFY